MATSDEPRFEQVLDRTSDAAFILEPVEDRFLAASSAGCTMLGYSLEELLQTPVSRIHPGELPHLEGVLRRVLRKGHDSTTTLTCRTRSGTCLPTDMALWAFGDEGRVYLLVLVRDRSDHRGRGR